MIFFSFLTDENFCLFSLFFFFFFFFLLIVSDLLHNFTIFYKFNY